MISKHIRPLYEIAAKHFQIPIEEVWRAHDEEAPRFLTSSPDSRVPYRIPVEQDGKTLWPRNVEYVRAQFELAIFSPDTKNMVCLMFQRDEGHCGLYYDEPIGCTMISQDRLSRWKQLLPNPIPCPSQSPTDRPE